MNQGSEDLNARVSAKDRPDGGGALQCLRSCLDFASTRHRLVGQGMQNEGGSQRSLREVLERGTKDRGPGWSLWETRRRAEADRLGHRADEGWGSVGRVGWKRVEQSNNYEPVNLHHKEIEKVGEYPTQWLAGRHHAGCQTWPLLEESAFDAKRIGYQSSDEDDEERKDMI